MIPLPELRSDLVARRGTGRASSEEPHACARDRSDASPDARPPLSFVGSDRVSALRLETAVLLLALLALELAILVPVHLVARRFRAAEPKVLVIAPRVLAEPLVVAPRVLAELALAEPEVPVGTPDILAEAPVAPEAGARGPAGAQ